MRNINRESAIKGALMIRNEEQYITAGEISTAEIANLQETISVITSERNQSLLSVKELLTSKFYNDLTDRLRAQEQRLHTLLLGKETETAQAALYSNPLSETYFEQLFF
jgi:hypothetical protein